MFEQIGVLVLGAVFTVSAILGVMFAGFRWGQFVADRAREAHESKWKAYILALMPPALFSLSFHFDQLLSPLAGRAFFGLGCAALCGAFLHWHERRLRSLQAPIRVLP